MEAFDTIRYRFREFRVFILVVAGMDLAIVTEKRTDILTNLENQKWLFMKLSIFMLKVGATSLLH
ncbi:MULTISPECIES: hypothetical protein [Bacillus cereus group]|uniref:Uncharacterized protein n=1 Tax=Bacillus toyonensis TaxID=155322 RepID=A0A2B5TV20_9BACI|nr:MULTISPECIES: hypothetical protein [Bacillus cereus group]OTX32854.1 hypothetical protein BK717_18900 [Bacillus thuringiensis serovar malayensis]OUB08468.1 hypothetical protein BK709_09740 [Bacillus thuringiensis serovar shandongiensis]MBJ8100498.1 hypothetical protein [Bacillus cereus group sp. N11]MBX0353812.1 hypothetical protein [Bacillus toyonensis]MDM5257858.1 hypothetical protein [Bacillus toyonensis]